MTLSERYWRASISVPGGFIASDNPVVMDGPKGQLVAFKNAEIVLFPVSRHVLLLSATRKVKPLPATYNRVAAINTFMMMTADEQVYSHTPNFYWLDENGKSQTDWRLSSKDRLMDCKIPGILVVAEQ